MLSASVSLDQQKLSATDANQLIQAAASHARATCAQTTLTCQQESVRQQRASGSNLHSFAFLPNTNSATGATRTSAPVSAKLPKSVVDEGMKGAEAQTVGAEDLRISPLIGFGY